MVSAHSYSGISVRFIPSDFGIISQNWPAGVIHSKGLFWIASRQSDALNGSQAGGSARAESTGVWWASMPQNQRVRYQAYIDNREQIESRWGWSNLDG